MPQQPFLRSTVVKLITPPHYPSRIYRSPLTNLFNSIFGALDRICLSLFLTFILNIEFLFSEYLDCVCSDRILTCRIKSIRSPAKVGLVVTDLITSPVVSWEGWETPPPPPQHRGSAVILCSTTGVVRPLCSCGDLLLSSARLLFTFGGCVTGILSLVLSIFLSFFLLG